MSAGAVSYIGGGIEDKRLRRGRSHLEARGATDCILETEEAEKFGGRTSRLATSTD